MVIDESCGAFRNLPEEALAPDAIQRMVIGEDAALRTLTAEQAAAELGDVFATTLLLRGRFPRTAGEVLAFFAEAGDADGSVGEPSFFLVGDGSQIAMTPDTAGVARNLRFLVALGGGPEGPDVLLSTFSPDQGEVEVMAWDRERGGFNYYRTVGASSGWVFAGNSRHALSDPTQGKGPFESHTSGNFLMKELRSPWIHWDSPAAQIFPSVFGGPPHEWFGRKELSGALACETAVARPSIVRWTKARFDGLVAAGGKITDPARIMRQLLETPTVNLISSHTEARNAASGTVDLPQTFFIDSEELSEVLGLQAPPPFAVSGPIYEQSLTNFGVHLSDGKGFEQAGDTHFAFCVPERALEDTQVLREARRIGLLSDRLAASLLMTDFANPIFSVRRASLMAHVPAAATVAAGAASFSVDMAAAILAAAETSPADSAEREFAELWAVGEDFKPSFDALLSAYYDQITERLQTQAGYDDYFRLAESRREHVEETMPIAESPLLFAKARERVGALRMLTDGSVAAG
jgi:hypothetical protein